MTAPITERATGELETAPLTVRIVDDRLHLCALTPELLPQAGTDAPVDLAATAPGPGAPRRRHHEPVVGCPGGRRPPVRRLALHRPTLGRRDRDGGCRAHRRGGRAHGPGRGRPRSRDRHHRTALDLAARAGHRGRGPDRQGVDRGIRRHRRRRSRRRPRRVVRHHRRASSPPRASASRRSTRRYPRPGSTAGPTRSRPASVPAPVCASTSARPTTSRATSCFYARLESLTDPTVVLPPLGADTADLLGTTPHEAVTLLACEWDIARRAWSGAPRPPHRRTHRRRRRGRGSPRARPRRAPRVGHRRAPAVGDARTDVARAPRRRGRRFCEPRREDPRAHRRGARRR